MGACYSGFFRVGLEERIARLEERTARLELELEKTDEVGEILDRRICYLAEHCGYSWAEVYDEVHVPKPTRVQRS